MKARFSVALLLVLLILALGLGIASCQPRPTPVATPTPAVPPTPAATPLPLAPKVLSIYPARGEELPPNAAMEITFDREVDADSVQLSFEPAWEGQLEVTGASVRFQPAAFTPGQRYTLQLAAAAQGLASGPLRFHILTQGNLEVASSTPADGNKNVAADAPLTIVFNRPVVPLGANPEDPNLPQPLRLNPPAAGKGSWLNTSIYMFQPTAPLLAGTEYEATVAGVTDLGGSALAAPHVFRFTTDLPVVRAVLPEGTLVPPTTPITITFSQPMDAASAEAALQVTAGAADNPTALAGAAAWSEDARTLVFTPSQRLPLGETISIAISQEALAAGRAAGLRRMHKHSFQVAPYPAVTRTQPSDRDRSAPLDEPVQVYFSAPILEQTLKLSISPAISATQVYTWYSPYDNVFTLFFPRQPLTDYTVRLEAGIEDPYGNRIETPTVIRFRTGERQPYLNLIAPNPIGSFNAYTETALIFSSVNVGEINAALYRLTPTQFAAIDPQEDYDRWRLYTPPAGQLVRRWVIAPDGPRNETVITRAVLQDGDGAPITPGLYFITADSPQVTYQEYDIRPRLLLVVSRYNVVIKRGRDDALVWATDLATGQPAADLPVTLYPADGSSITGSTDADGVFYAAAPILVEPWRTSKAFVGTDADPAWATTNWSEGLSAWNFDLPSEYYNVPYRIHLYTERPLYRAGDTIHYRAVIRSDDDVQYSAPAGLPVQVQVRNPRGEVIFTGNPTTDAFGAVYGDIPLAGEAELGVYGMELQIPPNTNAWTNFLVAAFRKPEYELVVAVEPKETLAGGDAAARVQSSYFFGGAVKNAQVQWAVYSSPYTFSFADDYTWSFSDFRPETFYTETPRPFREAIANGEGQTDAEGVFTLDAPTELQGDAPASELRTIEFTVTDVNDQQVSGTADLVVHAAAVYAGVRPEGYVGVVGEEQQAHFLAVDALSKQPIPAQAIAANVVWVEWRTVREQGEDGRLRYVSKVIETPVMTTTVTTGSDGLAHLDWTPTEAGQYLIRAAVRDAQGRAMRSAAFFWVSGQAYAPWQLRNDDRIELVADRELYQVGETARVLVPSPFQGTATALITIERAGIFRHEVKTLLSNSEVLEIPIRPEYAPNVFVSVLLISPPPADEGAASAAFKMGLAQINVDPGQHRLNVTLAAQPDPASPGDTVTYQIRATDTQGQPVQTQLSLAMVDRALLSLRPETGPSIADTFWNRRGLGVQTGVSLVVSLNRVDEAQTRGTKGGGGGGYGELAAIDVRSDFRDIAFWQADVETDANGEASVQVALPDNLTTWQMRAVAADQAAAFGEATQNLLVTKPLLIRPVLPRFVVHGDRFTLGAIVQNNTGSAQQVALTFEELAGLQRQGEAELSYTLTIPNGELTRVDLPVQVEALDPTSRLVLEQLTVRMAAVAADGAYSDRVEFQIPVRRYSSPETVATAGIVTAEEPRYEAISLPDRYDPTQGDLTVRLEPSLAAGMTQALEYLKHYEYECTEQTVSRFLPNVLTARALTDLGLEQPELAANLAEQVSVGLQRLYTRQNPDGGWGWFGQEKSNPYTSAYVLFGLTAAHRAGFTVDEQALRQAAAFVERQLRAPDTLQGYKLNQQAFFVYVLTDYASAAEGALPLAEAQQLFAERERMAVYAQAYLALALDAQSGQADTAAQAQALLDAISGQAVVTATGAHWEEQTTDWWTMNTDTRTTSTVLAAMAAIQPDHALAPNVVRWLMSARTADRWESTHETAWALIALTDWMVVTGELQANYTWQAAFNGATLGEGQITPADVTSAQTLRVAIGDMLADQLNLLAIERGESPGQLYYAAYLRTFLPVPDLQPVSRGLTIARRYTLAPAPGQPATDPKDRPAITSAKIGDVIDVELTLVLPTTMHYLLVEDPIPAGTEPIDTSLATTSLGASGPEFGQDPEAEGEPRPYWWDWYWYPTSFELKDDKVALFATELTPGAYVFRYQLRASVAGEFNVLPARGEMMYFPETFGHSAGSAFTVTRP